MSGVILCAIDIGQPKHEAKVLKRAAQMAKLDDARLDVLSVVPNFGNSVVGSFFPANYHDQAVAETKKVLSKLVEQVLGSEENDKVRHVIATGTVYEEVLRVAESDEASVIVLGSHRPALRDYLLGPNAARVVRHASCSVFVVR